MSAPLDRRRFLTWSGAALVGLVAAACGGARASGPKVELGALPDLFPDRAGVEQIGKHAVKLHEVGRRPRDIAAALAPDRSAAWVGGAPPSAIRKQLRAQVAADFARNRVIDVAGWQLPLTEARVAALIYLSG